MLPLDFFNKIYIIEVNLFRISVRKTEVIIMKKILAVLLAAVMLCCVAAPAAFAQTRAEAAGLKFKDDGSFRILNFSDIQDDASLSGLCKSFLYRSVKELEPDLILLTGDNIAGYSTGTKVASTIAIRQYMDIFEMLGVPVAIVFGNHDDDDDNKMTKEDQMAFYETYKCNISFDEGDAIDGVGTYNIPIYSSKGDGKVVFNIWMIDSGTYDDVHGGYDHVKQSQIDWYRQTSERLEEENGGLVPSLAFQHIIVREIWDALEKTDAEHAAIESGGVYYKLPDNAVGVLGESPCPGTVNSGEFAAMKARGDVLGIVSGHDHVNTFVIPYEGVDIINTPTCGFASYGNNETRGARVFDLKEDDAWNYSTFTVTFEDVMKNDIATMAVYKIYSFIMDLWNNHLEPIWDKIKAAFDK